MKLTIGRKLFLSYLAMALLTIMASAYAVFSLQNLNELAYTIIDRDFFILDSSKKMMDTLLAQESAEKKYLILKDPSIEEIFRMRSREFKTGIEDLRKNQIPDLKQALSLLSAMHIRHEALFDQTVVMVKENRVEEALIVSERDSRKIIDDMAAILRGVHKNAQKDIDSRMNMIRIRGMNASRMTIILSAVSLFAGLTLALIITYNISRPIRELKKATGLIAEGKFDYDLNVKRHDEIGSLADAFEVMTERLKVLEALNLDASPLTGLPGNLAIEKEIEKRLAEKKPFSLCHVDLDNFKPFADKYGYAWGSEVIKEVASILTEDMQIADGEDDFIGHIGGDDFVIISDPRRAENFCSRLVNEFDRHIMKFYSEKDRQKGFIIGKDRQGGQQKFPLITVSVAMVTDDGTRFQSPLDMAKKAAELKEYAKTLPGSNYVKQEDLEKIS
ncbi:MAG: diguanylate cyclase [Deltaproteobacteria bacterium]|nr:diguanylate cyclase [Deltaproteobacteria bacterium]